MTIEIKPIKFIHIGTHLRNKDGIYITIVHRKETKVPAHWSLQIHKRYKRNSIKVDLLAIKRFPLTSKNRLNSLGANSKVDFPLPLINSVIKDFIN